MYDAIIVGARCAGSPAAMLLAKRGYRVLVLDRATFPSDTISTHMIWHSGAARLKNWGLLDRVRSTGCPPITSFRLDLGSVVLSGNPPPAENGVRESLCVRRTVLDKLLVDAARQAGAEVREAFSVDELLFEDGRVTGIRGRSKGGSPVNESARIVIGADGMHSFVASAVAAPKTHEREPVACAYYSYWSGVTAQGAMILQRPRRTLFVLPTNDALTCVVTALPAADLSEFRGDLTASFFAALDLVPELAAQVRAGRQAERFTGGGPFLNFFRKPYGPGWALVGDAGYHKDPYTAQGISDAFRQVDLLVEAIDDGFSGRRDLEAALADYERRRNEAVLPEFESTVNRATHRPASPETLQLFSALRGNQRQIDRFFGTDAGTVAHADFFSPKNIQQIMQAGSPAPQSP